MLPSPPLLLQYRTEQTHEPYSNVTYVVQIFTSGYTVSGNCVIPDEYLRPFSLKILANLPFLITFSPYP